MPVAQAPQVSVAEVEDETVALNLPAAQFVHVGCAVVLAMAAVNLPATQATWLLPHAALVVVTSVETAENLPAPHASHVCTLVAVAAVLVNVPAVQ